MNANVLKFAPTAVILVAAMVCAWPYLGVSTPETPTTAEKVALPEIAPTLLTLSKLPRPLRDPFLDLEIYRIEARKQITQALKELIKPIADPKKTRTVVKNGGTTTGTKLAGAKAIARDAPEIDPREGLVLRATSAHSQRGSAVINGHVYMIGDQIESARTIEPCVLAEVRPNQAVIKYRTKTYLLDYPFHVSESVAQYTPAVKHAPKASQVPVKRAGSHRGRSSKS